MATMARTIHQQLSSAEVHAQLDRVVEQLREPFPQVAELPADAAPDILAFTACPVDHRQKLWSNNPQGKAEPADPSSQSLPLWGRGGYFFPNRAATRRLVGAVLAEQHDEWVEPADPGPNHQHRKQSGKTGDPGQHRHSGRRDHPDHAQDRGQGTPMSDLATTDIADSRYSMTVLPAHCILCSRTVIAAVCTRNH